MLNLSNEIECKVIQFVDKTLNDLGPEMSAVGPTRAGCVGDQINRLPWVRAGVGITLKIVGTHW